MTTRAFAKNLADILQGHIKITGWSLSDCTASFFYKISGELADCLPDEYLFMITTIKLCLNEDDFTLEKKHKALIEQVEQKYADEGQQYLYTVITKLRTIMSPERYEPAVDEIYTLAKANEVVDTYKTFCCFR